MAPPGYVTCQPLNATTAEATDLGKDDLNALLYIVVTLLFYSMGIIIGIITYLKREQAEMEEDKMFDLYLSLKREPFNLYKQERVQQMADYLKQVEEARIAREKIEMWNADQQLHNSKSCCADNLSQREPGESSTALSSRKDGSPMGMPESEFHESAGASALLCSLTFGVCEPLLTPEGAKSRFPYPGRPVLVKPSDPQSSPRTLSQRHSAPSLNSVRVSKSTDTDENEESSDDVFNTYAPDLYLGKKNTDDFPDSKKELQELRLLDFRLAKAAFQKGESKSSDQSSISCEHPVLPASGSACPRTDTAPSTALRRSSMLKRQLSLDSDGKTSSPDSSQTETTPMITSTNPAIEEELSNFVQNPPICPEQSYLQQFSSSNPATFICEPTPSKETTQTEREPILHAAGVPETSLQQYHKSDRKPPISTADVRPKVYDSFLSSTPVISSDTKDTLPAAKRRLYSPHYDSWRKGMAQTVDIPDMRARHGTENTGGRRKNNDKRLIPRPQTRDNERRGALLFTQKSLHHIESDNPKPGGMKKDLLKRQESADSYSSRNTEQSDLAESPLRRSGAEQSLSPEETDTGSPHSRPQTRVPRLVRSQTVDATKTYEL